jgi:hypothetical protein
MARNAAPGHPQCRSKMMVPPCLPPQRLGSGQVVTILLWRPSSPFDHCAAEAYSPLKGARGLAISVRETAEHGAMRRNESFSCIWLKLTREPHTHKDTLKIASTSAKCLPVCPSHHKLVAFLAALGMMIPKHGNAPGYCGCRALVTAAAMPQARTRQLFDKRRN